MTRTLAVLGVLLLVSAASCGVEIISTPSHESVVATGAREAGPVQNPHGDWIFEATGTRSCADCHDMGAATRGRVPVLDNAAVRNLIALGKGAHRGRFAACFGCHAGGAPRGEGNAGHELR